ncbi:hypothetical protein Goarm_003742 [Gossypium armourianum]|uniref:Uncharacterized protein n=1 Tax=Gossypium armourianum TaxID=34283 RepID=A0A7J9K483_9ROSI|nr:hypothetical protein [Gossypium armourianum]
MMGWDDIPVGLGDVFAMNQSDNVFPPVGDCKYAKAIPHGSERFLDSDTLYGLAQHLPQSHRSIPSNKYAEFNVSPSVFRIVSLRIRINITLISLKNQRKVGLFPEILERLNLASITPEVQFVKRQLFKLYALEQIHH